MHEPSPRILLVDDDAVLRAVLTDYLNAGGFTVQEASDAHAALGAVGLATPHPATGTRALTPDLVILDLSLPGMDGLEVFRRMRAAGRAMPVIMLTARGEEPERILGLEIGADDYIAKPCSPREVVLRARSVLRRTAPTATTKAQAGSIIHDGNLTLDTRAGTVTKNGRPLALTPREYALLEEFLTRPGELLSRDAIMSEVWQWDFGDASTVTVHVRRLREKVERDPAHPERLITVWGRGYRWEARA